MATAGSEDAMPAQDQPPDPAAPAPEISLDVPDATRRSPAISTADAGETEIRRPARGLGVVLAALTAVLATAGVLGLVRWIDGPGTRTATPPASLDVRSLASTPD